jgi:hypothetical protein
MKRYTFFGTVDLDNGKTITVECDRYGDRYDTEAPATIRNMFERLCAQRGWTPLWDTLKVEKQEGKIRA